MTHPTSVDGFDGSLQELAQRVHRMRYDKVAEFYRYSEDEIVRQAQGDSLRNRLRLASELFVASQRVWRLTDCFGKLWEMCKPYEERGIR